MRVGIQMFCIKDDPLKISKRRGSAAAVTQESKGGGCCCCNKTQATKPFAMSAAHQLRTLNARNPRMDAQRKPTPFSSAILDPEARAAATTLASPRPFCCCNNFFLPRSKMLQQLFHMLAPTPCCDEGRRALQALVDKEDSEDEKFNF